MTKKLIAMLLVLAMVFTLVACGTEKPSSAESKGNASNAPSNDVQSSGETAEVGRFKIGTIDTGTSDATSAPLLGQLKLTVEALGSEYVTATPTDMSGEGTMNALQNLIAAGCDAILLPSAMISLPKVAQMCDEAGVYWGIYYYHLDEGTEDYEAAMNSEYFVGTTYEDDVYSAYYATKILGEQGCKNICMVGLPSGMTTSIARDKGIAKACEEYGINLLAEERDYTLTASSAGGATMMERFLTAYPECDGIILAGMAQYCLPGIVQTLEQMGKVGEIKIAGVDFNEYQYDYMKSGALSGIIGGHFAGPSYTAILMLNLLNGTPLTSEKVQLQDNFIELGTYEEAQTYGDYINSVGYLYSEDEIRNCLVAYNPDFTFEKLQEMIASYSLQDLLDRNGQ